MQSAKPRQSNRQLDCQSSPGLMSEPMHISTQEIAQMTPEDVAQLAQRLEQDEYANAFEGLQDWHRLRAVAFQRAELAEPYVHLLDLETYDES